MRTRQPGSPVIDDETRRQHGSVATASTRFDVAVVEGPSAGSSVSLDPARAKALVGKSPLCDLRIDEPVVSRRHLSLELTERGLLVTDLESTNGTFIGDARVRSAYVVSGARIRLGSSAIEVRAAATEPARVRRAVSFLRMASASPRMMNVLSLCERLASTQTPVILEGETGTGKERLAECMHEASAHAAQPFVVLDCRTTPRDLVEAHLFGERLADGTVKPGIFEAAAGGTLFVDEPGDLDPEVQGKLLRAIEKGVIVRVGETTPIEAHVRVVVATSRDLDRLVEEGRFREDLYFRLAGARVELPPLRRRREDIPLLAAEIWSELGGRGHIPDEVLERYEGYDWPGNVRELERAVERFLALGDKASLLAGRSFRAPGRTGSLPSEGEVEDERGDPLARILATNVGYSEARRRVLEEFELAYLEKALADSGGNVAAAAAASGIARRHFQRIRARRR